MFVRKLIMVNIIGILTAHTKRIQFRVFYSLILNLLYVLVLFFKEITELLFGKFNEENSCCKAKIANHSLRSRYGL